MQTLTQDKPLPISIALILLIMGAILSGSYYVWSIRSDVDNHEKRITNIESKQSEEIKQLVYQQIILIRIADKLGVDTSNPLDKSGDIIKNLNADISIPF